MNLFNHDIKGIEILSIICPTTGTSREDIISSIERAMQDLHYTLLVTDKELLRSVDEAISNAIIHGNNENPRKNIRVKMLIHDNYLYLSIRDEGHGFNHLRISGRKRILNKKSGIPLIKQLSIVSWNKKGNEIIMKFPFKHFTD